MDETIESAFQLVCQEAFYMDDGRLIETGEYPVVVRLSISAKPRYFLVLCSPDNEKTRIELQQDIIYRYFEEA